MIANDVDMKLLEHGVGRFCKLALQYGVHSERVDVSCLDGQPMTPVLDWEGVDRALANLEAQNNRKFEW